MTSPPNRGEHGVCMHEVALVAQSVVCHKVPRSMLFLHMCSHHLLSCCDCSSSNKYMVREFLCGTPGCGNERCHDLTLSLSPGLLEAIQPRRPATGIWCFARSSGVLMIGGSTPSPDKLLSFAFPGNLNTIYGCRLAARWPDKLSFAFQGSLTKESVWGSGSVWAGRDDRLANHWQIRGAANTGRGGFGPANGKATASAMVALPWCGGKPYRSPRAVQLPPGTQGCGFKTRPPSRGEHGGCLHEVALDATSHAFTAHVPSSLVFVLCLFVE